MSEDSPDARYLAAINRLLWRKEAVSLSCTPAEWFCVIAAIQLAHRHPEYTSGSAAAITHRIVSQLGQLIADEEDMLELIAKGWDPRQDVPRTGNSPAEQAKAKESAAAALLKEAAELRAQAAGQVPKQWG